MNVIFVNFATPHFRNAQAAISNGAMASGVVSRVINYDAVALSATEEYQSLPESIKQGRAFGYFWWKPYVIRKTLELVRDGDLVFYSDCGRYDGGFRIGNELRWLAHRYRDTGFVGVEVPQFGPSGRWTKMDCFLGLSKDVARDLELPQIQATFSLWRNSQKTRAFVTKWEKACRIPEWITDDASISANDIRFIAHRHDQSILTLLARQHSMPHLVPVAKWERPFIQKFARTHEANVCFKQVRFVTRCLQLKCAVPLLGWHYACRKTKIIFGADTE